MNVKYKKYIDYIVKDIELPYLKSLKPYGLKQEEMNLVLGIVFNQPVIIKGNNVFGNQGNIIYIEDSDGYWIKYEYNDKGKLIYIENCKAYWQKWEYDYQGNQTYYEDADGYWQKKEYNQRGNLIYFENSDGDITDNR